MHHGTPGILRGSHPETKYSCTLPTNKAQQHSDTFDSLIVKVLKEATVLVFLD